MQLNGLQPLADIVSRAMMSSSSLAALDKAGLNGSYTVARDTTTDGPVITVVTKADTPAAALTDLRLVAQQGRTAAQHPASRPGRSREGSRQNDRGGA